MPRQHIDILAWLDEQLGDALPTEAEIPAVAKRLGMQLDKLIALPPGLEQIDGPAFRFVIGLILRSLVKRKAKRAQPKPSGRPGADPGEV